MAHQQEQSACAGNAVDNDQPGRGVRPASSVPGLVVDVKGARVAAVHLSRAWEVLLHATTGWHRIGRRGCRRVDVRGGRCRIEDRDHRAGSALLLTDAKRAWMFMRA